MSSILCLVGCSLLGASGLGMISMYIRLKAGMHYFAIVAPVLLVLSGLMAGFYYVETAVLSQDQAPELLAGFPLQKEMLMILFAAGLLLHIVGFIGFRCGMRKCAVEL